MQMIVAPGKTAVKDSAGNVMIKDNLMLGASSNSWSPRSRLAKDNGFSLSGSFGGVSGGIKFADNALTCDSEGNCMLKDNLWKAKGCIGKLCGGISSKLADNALTCDSEGNCMLKDDLIKIGGSFGGIKGGIQFADNSLTCDSEGNCMLKDELRSQGNHALDMVMSEAKKDADHRRKMMDAMMAKMKDNLGGVSVGYGKSKVGINWADNALTCDSEGNCMLKDDLIKFGASGCAFGVCANIKTADNALTCDSEGNCMLKDKLIKIGGSFGGIKGGIQFGDNSLTCDSAGNCMLKDSLALRRKPAAVSIKDQVKAEFEKELGGKTIKEAVAADIAGGLAEKVEADVKEKLAEQYAEENAGATADEIKKAVEAELMEETGGLSIKDKVAAEIAASLK